MHEEYRSAIKLSLRSCNDCETKEVTSLLPGFNAFLTRFRCNAYVRLEKNAFLKITAGTLSVVLFLTNSLLVSARETNFWSERRKEHPQMAAAALPRPSPISSILDSS